MAGQSRTTKALEGALDWVKRLPAALAKDVTVDVGQKRMRLSHARVEALTRQALRNVKALELRAWESRPEVYDVRLAVSGWKIRVEATLEHVELASGRYTLWLRTPGKVELEESLTASALMGVLRAGAGNAAARVLADKLLPPGIRWNGQVLEVEGKLPAHGVVPARLFDTSSLVLSAEHDRDGLWLSAEAWPGLMDLLQAVFHAELPRKPPGA
jgi:hypothetical protein